MSINAAIFPFQAQTLPVIQQINQIQGKYHIYQAIAWSGMGLAGRDAAFVLNRPPIGVPVITPPSSLDAVPWNTLLVDCDAIDAGEMGATAQKFLRSCLEKGKDLLLLTSQPTWQGHSAKWQKLKADYAPQIQEWSIQNDCKSFRGSYEYNLLSVPVILVGGLVTDGDALEIVLSLRNAFQQHGLVASCLASCTAGLLLGMHSYAHIFGNASVMTEAQKALELNSLAQSIIHAERPSVFIVEAPDAIMKYNNIAPNGFGLQTYILSQALMPDLLVCCTPADLFDGSFLEALSHDFEVRYGCPIAAAHVSNALIDSAAALESHAATCVHIKPDAVDRIIRRTPVSPQTPAFNAVTEGIDGLYHRVVANLAELQGWEERTYGQFK